MIQARAGCASVLTTWNLLNTVSSVLVGFGSACHLARIRNGVKTSGALGVALKSFGLIDYLRSFPATGSLVRMISVRTHGMLTQAQASQQLGVPIENGCCL